jgi:hypothetical protein
LRWAAIIISAIRKQISKHYDYDDKAKSIPENQEASAIHMKQIFILFFLLALNPASSSAGDLYKWVDKEGVVHMTDTLSQVPPQYREQVEKKYLQTTAQPDAEPVILQKNTIRKSESGVPDLQHFEVPYKAFEGASRRIIISATLNESVTACLLLDTGSPGLMISPELATRLGLLDDQKEGLKILTGGIGGTTPATLAVVDTIRVGDAISEFLPAVISQIPSNEFEGLVGMDFLANYKVSIDTNRNVLVFNELPPQSDKPGGHDEAWWRSNFRKIAGLRADWSSYLDKMKMDDTVSNEKERRIGIARNQYEEADKLYRKLERYARDKTVPMDWRH